MATTGDMTRALEFLSDATEYLTTEDDEVIIDHVISDCMDGDSIIPTSDEDFRDFLRISLMVIRKFSTS